MSTSTTDLMQETPEAAEAALSGFLETLVPPNTIKISDIFGNEYVVQSAVSAKKQIQILRQLDALKAVSLDMDFAADDLNVPNLVNYLIELAINEKVFNVLQDCFYIAHNQVVRSAVEHSRDTGGSAFAVEPNTVGELFSIEEIVAGVVPLFARLARRTGSLLTVLGQ